MFQSAEPELRDLRMEAVTMTVGYVAGALGVLALPDASGRGAFIFGVGVLLAVGIGLQVLWTRRFPKLGWRPWRYSLPAAAGLVAFWGLVSTRTLDGDAVYIIGAPILLLGIFAADYWWLSATSRREGVSPAIR